MGPPPYRGRARISCVRRHRHDTDTVIRSSMKYLIAFIVVVVIALSIASVVHNNSNARLSTCIRAGYNRVERVGDEMFCVRGPVGTAEYVEFNEVVEE